MLAVLLDDADMVNDIEQELAHRTQPMPLWLRGLRETRVLDARLIDMPDARGQDLLLGMDWAGGGTGTYVVYIDHGRGTVVSDAFPTPVSIDVVVGQKLAPGDLVGLSGNTGHSTGPHLHLEIHPGGGAAIDPAPWLHDHGLQ